MNDLEAEVRPCPKGATRFRAEVQAKGGNQQFPYLEDPNTGAAMYESSAIIEYLYKQYGRGTPPSPGGSAPATYLSAPLAALMRPAEAGYTGTKMFESAAIKDYLLRTYAKQGAARQAGSSKNRARACSDGLPRAFHAA